MHIGREESEILRSVGIEPANIFVYSRDNLFCTESSGSEPVPPPSQEEGPRVFDVATPLTINLPPTTSCVALLSDGGLSTPPSVCVGKWDESAHVIADLYHSDIASLPSSVDFPKNMFINLRKRDGDVQLHIEGVASAAKAAALEHQRLKSTFDPVMDMNRRLDLQHAALQSYTLYLRKHC